MIFNFWILIPNYKCKKYTLVVFLEIGNCEVMFRAIFEILQICTLRWDRRIQCFRIIQYVTEADFLILYIPFIHL